MAKVTLFPSETFPEPASDALVPLMEFEQLVRRMVASVNKDERASAVVRNLHRISIVYDEALTPQEAISRLKASLKTAANTDGLTPEEAQTLLNLLRAL